MKVTILFYPDPLKPKPLSRVYRIIKDLDWIDFHNDPTRPYDLHIFWSYTKSKIIPDDVTMLSTNVINRGCYDITKQKVNDIFNDININPRNHHGICVEKLEQQGRHGSHKLLYCPTNPRQGFVYQKFIENKEGDLYFKYRVYYMDKINYVLKTYKKSIFVSDTVKVESVPKEQLFTPEQEQDFIQKCHKFGIDFGEFDVMIDNGLPVIIDVNNVVGGEYVQAITGTPISLAIDDTFLAFIKERYAMGLKYLWGV